MSGPREAVLTVVEIMGIHGGTKAREINIEGMRPRVFVFLSKEPS